MQNTSTSRSTDFSRLKPIALKMPLTLYGRDCCARDRTSMTSGLPAGPQSNQKVWVLPPIWRNGVNEFCRLFRAMSDRFCRLFRVTLTCGSARDVRAHARRWGHVTWWRASGYRYPPFSLSHFHAAGLAAYSVSKPATWPCQTNEWNKKECKL